MRLTIINQTGSTILYYPSPSKSLPADLQIALLPSSSTTTDLQKHCSTLTLLPREQLKHDDSPEVTESRLKRESAEGFHLRVNSLGTSRAWGLVQLDGYACPWRLYRITISRKHQKLLILPRRGLSSFLSDIPDNVFLSSLLLPGTHETMAFYGWPISQCQSPSPPNPLLHQLNSGIRALDLRLSIIDGKLIAYHGRYPQRTPFTSILATLYEFLLSPSSPGQRETIVVSVKQEDTASSLFTALVQSDIAASEGGNNFWYTESNRIPTLGEVRGRCVLFSRFGERGAPDLGLHPDRWPDSQKEGFEWMCGETVVRVSDWYAIQSFLSIPEKVTQATAVLLPPTPSQDQSATTPIPPPCAPPLSISFFSAASIPLALPPTVACGFGWPEWGFGVVGVNERIGAWLLSIFSGHPSDLREVIHSRLFGMGKDKEKETVLEGEKQPSPESRDEEPRLRGWTFMDFFQDPTGMDIVPLLVECNFRGQV